MSGRVGVCPKCGTGKVPLVGMPRCGGCGNLWLTRTDFERDVASGVDKRKGYLTDGSLSRDLEGLVEESRLSMLREMREQLIVVIESVERSLTIIEGVDSLGVEEEVSERVGELRALKAMKTWVEERLNDGGRR